MWGGGVRGKGGEMWEVRMGHVAYNLLRDGT